MCGLAGMMGPGITQWDLDVITELSYVSGLRGTHSSGVFQGKFPHESKKNSNWFIEKGPYDISYFTWYHKVAKEGNKRVFNDIFANIIAVHTRSATKGLINKENSHPFELENIVGMHNGTMREYKYNNDDKKTDSELLLKDINDRGIIPVLKEVGSFSAYALVIIDKNTGKITFARNKERTLYGCFNAHRAVMYWASEQWMLKAILARNREFLLEDTVFEFKPNQVYTCHPTDIRKGIKEIWDIKRFVPKTYPTYPEGGVGRSVWMRPDDKEDLLLPWKPEEKKDQISQIVSAHQQDNQKSNVISMVTHKKDYKDKIPEARCAGCSKSLSLSERYFSTMISPNTFICTHCQLDCPIPEEKLEEVILN